MVSFLFIFQDLLTHLIKFALKDLFFILIYYFNITMDTELLWLRAPPCGEPEQTHVYLPTVPGSYPHSSCFGLFIYFFCRCEEIAD